MPLTDFQPTLKSWFRQTLGEPTPAQRRGWPLIRSGRHTLIAAPTGSGKTLAAFLSAIDALLRQGDALPDATQVLYVSPLKALGTDIQKNLQQPLEELRRLNPTLPEIRVLVRSGDTPQRERASMAKRPPHILVTTPESFYILLTTEAGRGMLRTVRTAIVDEIHAVLGSKRGSHLALSLERLEMLSPRLQRIGLSATQKPLEDVGHFLVGAGRDCALVDEGHLRELDVGVEIPPSPLSTVCSHETWSEIYARIAELIGEHRTTLIFVGTRKMAERIGAQLSRIVGEDAVTCHHSSLSKERRLDAEQRLKAGRLRALVATASLELGIDIGDIDLVIQIGAVRAVSTFLQRVGRAGHGVGRLPKGRLFPLTHDELVEAAAVLYLVRRGVLDRTPQPSAPLDILAQQIVAACVPETHAEDGLLQCFRHAWPYRDLDRETFDRVVALHCEGRYALVHRDGVNGRLRGTRRARLTAITSGGAIPDSTQYRVALEPEGTTIGSVDEDFAVESSSGDVFQLGNASWRVLKIEPGVLRVADAHGVPPSLPFWFGEAPARTQELSAAIGTVRERGIRVDWLLTECGIPRAAAEELAAYLREAHAALGAVPTQDCVVLERFFDESGGMQLVVHAPFGGRINRAYGLALRKRFCRRFGFELQAAANEEAIVLSLGPQHSFPLDEVFEYLHPNTARDVLTQAVLPTPLFRTRWRWNVTRSLLLERTRGGQRVPAPLLRMRADDRLAQAFPDVVACGENLPAGDIAIPWDHPIVAQTMDDCLHEAMDADGFLELLEGMRDGRVRTVAVETSQPSPFAKSILNAQPYSFLDDAPLEERRTQAVYARRVLDPKTLEELGALDPAAVDRVREEAWPDPRDAEELHEALLWMGYVTTAEAGAWLPWLEHLAGVGRVYREDDRWYATEASRDPKAALRGRMEALGPVHLDDPLLIELEREGVVVRAHVDGRMGWCDRRLLARIRRYTLDRLRREIQPVSAAAFTRFLAAWQHVDADYRLEGPAGVREVLRQLAGFEARIPTWERYILRARVRDYRPDWLDRVILSGEFVWGRLWGSSRAALRSTPICFVARDDLDSWLGLGAAPTTTELSAAARTILDVLTGQGAMFPRDLQRASGLLPAFLERGIEELIAAGLLTSDSFTSARALLRPAYRRKSPAPFAGRWSLYRSDTCESPSAEFVARQLVLRYGVVFRALIERERQPIPWRELLRAYRRLELRGEIRGGRFVERFAGEQFALPEAIPLLREIRRERREGDVVVSAADPLNLKGILTPDRRVPSTASDTVAVLS